MPIRIDRDLPVPVPLQLQGQIEYGVTSGDFPPGSRLPSVRELAADLGVSPVTVSAVYRRLRSAGLIDGAPGRGTF
ncbi:GntR family transcriptional regulator, partial [Arthrospira platensis SPKY2]